MSTMSTKDQWETVKGNAINVGDELMFHRLQTVAAIRTEVSPFDASDITRYATIKTPYLLDATEIRLDPKQSYRRLRVARMV